MPNYGNCHLSLAALSVHCVATCLLLCSIAIAAYPWLLISTLSGYLPFTMLHSKCRLSLEEISTLRGYLPSSLLHSNCRLSLEETGFAGHICQTIKQCLCKRIIRLAIDVSSFNGFAGSERGHVIRHFYRPPHLKKVKIGIF